ncbi:MAG: hypothetical protein EB164_09880, partial [Thaumarchaeota archaeon]|nr:hypothetical protein [Nitrososphaerota archaeon]
ADYLKNHPDVIKKLIAAHVDETLWVQGHKEESLQAFNAAFKKLTGQTMPEDQLKEAASRLDITYDPIQSSLFKSADAAFKVGLLGDKAPDLSGIYDLTLLDQVLKEKGLTKKEATSEKKVSESTTSKDAKKETTKKTDKKDTAKKSVKTGVKPKTKATTVKK